VPKHNLATDLVDTVRSVLSIARARRESLAVLDSMTSFESQYVLSNSAEGLGALLGHFKEMLKQMRLFEDADLLRVSTALYEAILNAIEHGNLELESSQRDRVGPYYRRVVEGRNRSPATLRAAIPWR
jgi:hypothetical protein